ncbi:MAG: cation diffusion facilitator family transporter [bacterium]|nr:cation diffusion facilitator family transporter [bacterium]
MSFNAWLIERFFSHRSRRDFGYLEAWVSIIGNILLFLVKFLFGLALNSIALIAEGFHSLSDVLTSIVVLLGFKFGSKPADEKHPFGHGRIEQIATLIIAFMLLLVAYEFGRTSIERIINPPKVEFNVIVMIFMLISALFKEWMARFSIFLGKKINSSALIADAWHHRSDAIASLLVGLGFIFVRFKLFYTDGILGLVVAVFIGMTGIELIKSSIDFLLGKAPDKDFLERVKDITLSVPGVLDLHDILVHDYQSSKVVSLHIEVEDNLSAKDAHRIALEVQDRLKKKLKEANISVHIDPRGERED